MKLNRVIPALLVAAFAATCTSLPITAPSNGAVEHPLSNRVGRHLGFDTYAYPGDRTMRAWRTASPYEWVGYYLPAPCHNGRSWVGKRERLEQMGWGMAVIYVGQQWWPHAPKSAEARRAIARGEAACANFRLTAAEGGKDADDAIARTRAEGFPTGTAIYLDIEYMDRTPPAMREYYRAWVARVLQDGRYLPGVYVHTRNAALVHGDVHAVFDAAGRTDSPPFWIASGRAFTTDSYPRQVGHQFASAWQGVLDVVEQWGGISLTIDVNVATTPSPSSWLTVPGPVYGD